MPRAGRTAGYWPPPTSPARMSAMPLGKWPVVFSEPDRHICPGNQQSRSCCFTKGLGTHKCVSHGRWEQGCCRHARSPPRAQGTLRYRCSESTENGWLGLCGRRARCQQLPFKCSLFSPIPHSKQTTARDQVHAGKLGWHARGVGKPAVCARLNGLASGAPCRGAVQTPSAPCAASIPSVCCLCLCLPGHLYFCAH